MGQGVGSGLVEQDDPWELRIGHAAAAIQRHSTRILILDIIFMLVVVIVCMPISMLLPLGGAAHSILILGIAVLSILVYISGLRWHWRLRAKACEEGATYIHLSQRTGERTLPGLALKNTTMFDNLMYTRGVSAQGRYVPHPSKSWVTNTQGRFGPGKY